MKRPEQLVLFDDATGALDQREQCVECFGVSGTASLRL
jgi:hypothetical protein